MLSTESGRTVTLVASASWTVLYCKFAHNSSICTFFQVAQLHERVNSYTQTGQERIKWTAIAKEVNRTVAQVKFKWTQCQYKPLGAFTAEEDKYILQAVISADGQVRGIWPKIGAELGRHANMVRARYLVLKSGARAQVPWTGEMV